jgi:hypothetical protein
MSEAPVIPKKNTYISLETALITHTLHIGATQTEASVTSHDTKTHFSNHRGGRQKSPAAAVGQAVPMVVLTL